MLGDEGIALLKTIIGLTVASGEESQHIMDSLNQGDYNSVEGYDLIAIHRSGLDGYGQSRLVELCKAQGAKLVLFSGGITQYSYTKEKVESLVLSSVDLYNKNRLIGFFQLFCANKQPELLRLVLGDNVELTRLMTLRQIITMLRFEKDPEVRDALELSRDRLMNELDVPLEAVDDAIRIKIEGL